MSDLQEKRDVVEYFSEFISESRKEGMENVLNERTRHITVALEDIYQPHNASAVIRSCDCFGVQDLHIIENRNEYTLNPDVTQGSSKWVDMHRYNEEGVNTVSCLTELKQKGYRIVATSPHADDFTPDNLPLDNPIALVFGNEKDGISDMVREETDMYLKIPMMGFTESFNISVSAALCLYRLTNRLRSENIDFALSEEEKLDLKLLWMKSVVKNGDTYLKNFYKNYKG